MKLPWTIVAVLISIGAGWLVYRSSLEDAGETSAPQPPRPAAVELVSLERRDLREQVELVGSLEPRVDVTLRSRVRGYITGLPYDVGDWIPGDSAAGQRPVVVELEDATSRELLRGAEAALKVARAQLAAKTASLEYARSSTARQLELADSGAAAAQELEQALSERAVAEAEVELEQARVDQALSEVERNRLAVEQTQLRAPFAGYLAERLVEAGDLANPDDPLVRLIDISTVKTVVSVVEQDYRRIHVGQEADVTVDAFVGQRFSGQVVRVAPILDPDTRTAAVQVEIDNPQGLLKPGMHARVSITSQIRRQAVVVPASSLVARSEQPSVFVVRGEPPRAEQVEVSTGLEDAGYVEILAGLAPEDRVVTLGANLLADGQPVTPLDRPADAVATGRQPADEARRNPVPHVGG